MSPAAVLIAIVALVVGVIVGWFAGGRGAAAARAERDARTEEFKRAVAELAQSREEVSAVRGELEAARIEGARLGAELRALGEGKDVMAAQFAEVAHTLLGQAQASFLERAQQRFTQAGETNEAKLKALLQPVETTLKRYEENLGRIEKEREGSYRELSQAVTQLVQGNASVVRETQRLANVMRSSPKARGRWGEEQLRTILESAGLAENVDFTLQTTVSDGERQMRPDCVVNLPGGRCIVIDVKCPLVAFEQAFDEEDEGRRADLLLQHANALKAYAADLGRKSYWRQFERSPDFVIMFVPGEHFLSAAAERAPDLIESAFRNGVVVASTINMLALAKIMAGIWRQEALREQAQEIAEAGKELYRRLATMSGHVAKLGRNLGIAAGAYNDMVGSLESQVYTQAKRFEALGVETGGKAIDAPPVVETGIRPLTKLTPPRDEAAAEAAE
ncbi:MAG TPA: DNA recombination protein RmuC [Sphingomonas sp.]|nr:DNA recombination protein RmuC [Sphingomonas sp.]